MHKNKSDMNKKIKSLMSKKELEIVESGSLTNVRSHTPDRLKQYIKLTRKLRDKYRDLTQRQIVFKKHTHNFNTVEKAKVFEKILGRYEKQFKKVNVDETTNQLGLLSLAGS
jgi:capsule polysaccharide export protein KpsE/RkpR